MNADNGVENGGRHELPDGFTSPGLLGHGRDRMFSLGSLPFDILDHSSRSSFRHRPPEIYVFLNWG